MSTIYPKWRCTYSNEEFDRVQALAYKLTAEETPRLKKYGYTREAYARAERIVREANEFHGQGVVS